MKIATKKRQRGLLEDAEETRIVPSLPDDIIHDILQRLPVKSISRFRCVCKHWHKLFKDPEFIDLHRNYAYKNDKFIYLIGELRGHPHGFFDALNIGTISDLFKVLTSYDSKYVKYVNYLQLKSAEIIIHGSCNGLILMSKSELKGSQIHLWNPATKEVKRVAALRDPHYNVPYELFGYEIACHIHYGFGYTKNIDDYKIVKVVIRKAVPPVEDIYDDDDDGEVPLGCEVFVYSQKSDLWEKVPEIIHYDIYSKQCYFESVLVNGCLHWRGTPCAANARGAWYRCILSFDIESQIIREVPLIDQLDGKLFYQDNRFVETLGELGGNLCMIVDAYGAASQSVEVWVMKEYGVRESWTKMFSISKQSLGITYTMKPLWNFKNGHIAFHIDNKSLGFYDPKNETWSYDYFDPRGVCHANTYVESLVSLNSG